MVRYCFIRRQSPDSSFDAKTELHYNRSWYCCLIPIADVGCHPSKGDKGISIEPVRFQKMKEAFVRHGGIVDQSAEAQAFLKLRGAEGVTFDAKTILLPENPTTSAVFEEFIHSAQHRTGLVNTWIEQFGNANAELRLEIQTAEKLIRNRKAYNIPNDETHQTIRR